MVSTPGFQSVFLGVHSVYVKRNNVAGFIFYFCFPLQVLERSTDTGSGMMELGCHPGDDGNVFVGVYAANKIEVNAI